MNLMNKFFIYIIITFTAFTSVQAQHPRVCDYVSLKHALKGREFEVITARPIDKAIELLHTKEEIRIPTIGEFGKEIDSLDIIDYNGDTVYIYRRLMLGWNEDVSIDIKSKKGAYRINKDERNVLFEQFEIEDKGKEECDSTPDYAPSIYPDLFEWDGMEKLLKDRYMALLGQAREELTKLIFDKYRLVHVDKISFSPLTFSIKKVDEMYKRSGFKKELKLENTLIHVYDTISKKNNDEYISIMHEDENIPPTWFKKGSLAIHLWDYEEKKKFFIYKEPDTESPKVYKFKEGILIIYDIIGNWYYVKTTDQKGKEHYGWIKIEENTAEFMNAELLKYSL